MTLRFGHYELLEADESRPLQLVEVQWAAGLDVDLRCPVTLKVINGRYLADELAKLRFFREARAAASVRHPNVASVFHLGQSGENYFYAMEFVEGQTLHNLIKQSGQLEAKLALEIAGQVAAGLAAVHKKNLVHRHLKPSNIMVSLDERGRPVTKIIDLWAGESDRGTAYRSGNFNAWSFCRDTGVCRDSGAIRRG